MVMCVPLNQCTIVKSYKSMIFKMEWMNYNVQRQTKPNALLCWKVVNDLEDGMEGVGNPDFAN